MAGADRRGLAAALAAAHSLLAVSAAASDRPTLSGAWSASALHESWTVPEWGEACGPRPAAQGAPGGPVTVREQGGELSITGAGRPYRTDTCWEQMPGLSRSSHSQSAGGRFWRTRCSTPASDPRRAMIETVVQATDSTISLNETGTYQFHLQGQTCSASVVRSRSYSLVRRDGETLDAGGAPSATPPSSAPATPRPQASPRAPAAACARDAGEPARLEVRPTRKLLRPGERFAFRAAVYDAEGCALPARPAFRVVTAGAKASVDASGAVTVHDDAPDGAIELSVALGGKGVRVVVEVTSPEGYEALLAARGLDATGEDGDAASAQLASASIGGSAAVAEDTARSRKRLFLAIVGGVAVVLGVAGLILLRRPRRTEAEGEDPDDEAPSADAGAPGEGALAHRAMACPTCHATYPTGSRFCAADAMALVPARPRAGSATPGGICPVCRKGYRPGVKACPEHGEDLVPAPIFLSTARRDAPPSRGKICPTCGGRYDGSAGFCGRDGTELVLLN